MCRSLSMARTTTSPELSPTRICTSMPCPRRSSSAYQPTVSCMRIAARHARTAWSSCASGAPNNAMIPSPITWFTVPSYRWTASIIRSSTGSRSLRASSGSRSASSSSEPFMSAKSTAIGLPHSLQNRLPGELECPHAGQTASRRSPQPLQNLAPAGLSCRHCGQLKRPPLGAFLHLDDLVGHCPVGLAVHRGRRFLAGGVDQAEDLACALVVPVPDVVDAVLALYLEVLLVRAGCHLRRQSVDLVVHVEIERHRARLLSHRIGQTPEGNARWQHDDREAPSSAHLADLLLDRSPSALGPRRTARKILVMAPETSIVPSTRAERGPVAQVLRA